MRMVLDWLGIAVVTAWYMYGAVVTTQQRVMQLTDLLADAQQNWQAACRRVDAAAAAVSSLPQDLAWNIGKESLRVVEAMFHTLARILLALLDMGGLVLAWILTSYRALFVCTVQLAVQGSLALLDAATQAIADAVRAAGQALEALLRTAIQGAQGAVEVATDTLNGVLGLFGTHVDAPQLREPAALQVLRNITLPPALVQPFHSVQLPTVDSLRAASRDTFDGVLQNVKQDIRAGLGSMTLPVPPRPMAHAPSDVCRDVPWSAFDDGAHKLVRLAYGAYFSAAIGAALALGLACGACWLRPGTRTPSARKADMQHRARTAFGSPLLVFVGALLLLHLGVVQVELGVVHAMRQRLDELPRMPTASAPALVGSAAEVIRATNAQLAQVQNEVNAVLARSVNEVVPGALGALNAVFDVISGTIRDVLGATPLQAPVQQFAMCVVGNKVLAAERMLRQLQSALRVDVPAVALGAVPAPAALLTPALGALADDALRPAYRALARHAATLERDRLATLCIGGASAVVVAAQILWPVRHQAPKVV
ncbi:plasma membrane fusion protein prm1 [Malassezia brasiliensis]|uniref:Plasma membrane fusion protein PRM1 n=1 Tax=Malassezia brasiliensis TaxID=1821822 RepID=A0AAF0DUZ2_9BASI|nr:plasma membrane fusion protein prm1 [Malassezia brasiliensis]